MSNMTINLSDLDDVEVATGSRETPDDGDYNLLITEAEYKNTKNGTGQGVALVMTIIDGPFAGNEVHTWINIVNSNSVAQNIGRSDMKALMTITGSQTDQDLKGKSIRARLIGEVSDFTGRDGRPAKSVNLRPRIYMDLEGRNAKGEKVPDFIAKEGSAKQQVAQWRASQGAVSNSGTDMGSGINRNNQVSNKADFDPDDIPF